jgi:hypothetical protein
VFGGAFIAGARATTGHPVIDELVGFASSHRLVQCGQEIGSAAMIAEAVVGSLGSHLSLIRG